MNNTFTVPARVKQISFGLIGVGLLMFIVGAVMDSHRAWPSLLHGTYYFTALAMGAMFFLALQHITQSGWSSMFNRIPEAMGSFLPIGAVLLLVTFVFGAHDIYHWTHAEALEHDELLQHKEPYLNLPFFYVRFFVVVGSWIMMWWLIRRNSLQEDQIGGVALFERREWLSKVFIFIMAITFTLGTIDWVMSIDPHWFSTIFVVKNVVASFHNAACFITLFVILLNRAGYFPQLNKSHLHDLSRYIWALSIMWGYMWFMQFFLIWFANVPEETVYYQVRTSDEWKVLFFSNIFINWGFPFLFLMLNRLAKNATALVITICILIVGKYIDLFDQIMPGTVSEFHIGFAEIGAFLFVGGLFIFMFTRTLSKANIMPAKHPYLEESLYHHTH